MHDYTGTGESHKKKNSKGNPKPKKLKFAKYLQLLNPTGVIAGSMTGQEG